MEKLAVTLPEVRWINPFTNTDNKNSLSLMFNVFEPLIRLGKDGFYHGVLAEEWTVSPDARTWIFSLRNPVYFHNQRVLTAEDVIDSLLRMINPDANSELGTKGIYDSYFHGADFFAVDDNTVKISLQSPMADLLDFLSKFPIVSRYSDTTCPEKMEGTGPYVLSANDFGKISMDAFPRYWGKKQEFDRIIWEGQPDSNLRTEALIAGHTDLVSGILSKDLSALTSNDDLCISSFPSSTCTVFMCNNQSGICTDRRIRQALNYAIDKKLLVQSIMNDAANVLTGPLTSNHFGFNPDTQAYAYDPMKAKALLSEAGYEHGFDLTLDVPSVLPDEALSIAKFMSEQYAQVGIVTHIKEFADRPAYSELIRSKRIDDACCFDSSPLSTYQVFSDKFHSGLLGAWWQGYKNLEVDNLINKGQKTTNNSQRKIFYQQAYQLIHDDAPWIFLFNEILYWGKNSKIRSWSPYYDGIIRII
ncbi:MAG: ABC transporter substrate-binding protein [Chloroflexi bacterium]|nr:ABC transporter substrate-binding protein [Chloroflexota bacterium]